MESLTSSSPMATYSPTLNSGIHEVSPAKRVFVTHHMLLRILRRRVKSLALIKVRYECPVSDIFQNSDKVTAKLKNGGEITAKYCIGCDGADGLAKTIVSKDNVTGHGLLSNSLTIVFRVHPPSTIPSIFYNIFLQCFTYLLFVGGPKTISKSVSEFIDLYLQSQCPRICTTGQKWEIRGPGSIYYDTKN